MVIAMLRQAHGSRAWSRFSVNVGAMIGITIVGIIVVLAILAPSLPIYDPLQLTTSFLPPSLQHPMGTDALGADVFSNVIHGARVSLIVGLCAVITSTIIGVTIGAASGYFGGNTDTGLMRLAEMFQIMPQFFLAIVIVALFGASIWNVVLVIGVLTWPVTARLLRAEFLTLRKRDYVDAARNLGMSHFDIVFREIMPNALPPIIVNCTLQISSAILLQTSLAFLGLGDPNAISWGTMLHTAQDYFSRAWWMAAFPGLALFLTTLSLNLVGDGLNDALNPKAL
ncbi:ABC transporter permease [Limoniibacter endophyticus]|uniref:ABC transporter permease n=1 Tax=Limoniibacter endophyticus TaxID=1565040 RepID=A0A8J3GIJ3_9HYPH|nr:ABC transporter permease [Limoniibacter endophyticus]GHC78940.1 ABC transporter permease [Limoniibacter endophyticus]